MRHNSLIHGGGEAIFFAKQSRYLAHVPANPTFGCVHDGVSVEYMQGFTEKPMHWLYRFRHNTNPRGATPLYLRNPGDKVKHWLEISNFKKFMTQVNQEDAYPHVLTALFCFVFSAWQISRYLLYHPDMTLYNVAMYPTKTYIEQGRYNAYHPMDKPSFRWTQRNSEFYSYDIYREMIDMGVIANDPFIEDVKARGLADQLTNYAEEGYGDLVKGVPKQYRYSHGFNSPKPAHH
jgi:hypothetical protein